MRSPSPFRPRSRALLVALTLGAMIAAPLMPAAWAIPPRAARVAGRRYARLSIAEARAVRAEARVVEIAPLVPVPPPPRPVTVRRMVRAGVPVIAPIPPVAGFTPMPVPPPWFAFWPPAPFFAPPAAVAVASPGAAPPQVVVPAEPTAAAAAEPGAWTLEPDGQVAPAGAEVGPDGTRSVLSAGGAEPPRNQPSAPPAAGPVVTQPPIELLPTPQAD